MEMARIHNICRSTDTREYIQIYLPFFLFLSHCRKKSGKRGSETWPTEEKRVSVKQPSKEHHVIIHCLSYPTSTALSHSLLSLPLLQQNNNNDSLKQMIQPVTIHTDW